jgi:RNA polymerase sigma-70 factor (ECF subfamily)
VIFAIVTIDRAPAIEDAVSDDVLLARFARGDGAALGELFDRHHRAAYRFLGRLTGADDADLDDLVQATFMEAARAAPRFDGRAAVRTWLFGIAMNVARHYKRGQARRRRVIDDAAEERPSEIPGRERPDEHAANRELLELVAGAVQALPVSLREVFVACEIEELPGADVARLLGIPEGTLWRRLHDARKALRTALGERT